VTVHRVVLPEEAARRDLGSVEVTIDDPDALITFLTRDGCELVIEFDGGGTFTEAKDLVSLSPMERKSIRLKTPKVEVVLNPSDAYAVGGRQETEDVFRAWADNRYTWRRPRSVWWVDMIVLAIMITSWIIIYVSAPRALVYVSHLNGPTSAGFIFGAGVACGATTVFYAKIGYRSAKRIAPASYAIIIAKSREQHERELSTEKSSRRSLIVDILMVIITVVGVAVTVWATVRPK
jgi:hypothetical protein